MAQCSGWLAVRTALCLMCSCTSAQAHARPMPPTAALCTPCLRCREHFGPSVGLFEQDPHLQNVYELDSSTPSKHSRHLLVRCARCRALNLGLLRTGRHDISADSVAGRMHFAVRAILLLVLLVHHRSTQCGPTGAACAGGTSGTVTDLPGSLQVRLPGHAFLDNQHCGKYVREVRAAIGACGCAGRWRRCARRQRARRQPARAPQTNIFAYSTRFSLHPLHLLGCASCSPWPAAHEQQPLILRQQCQWSGCALTIPPCFPPFLAAGAGGGRAAPGCGAAGERGGWSGNAGQPCGHYSLLPVGGAGREHTVEGEAPRAKAGLH